MNKRKLYCIFARESLQLMNGNRGKMAAQAGHAFLHSFWDAEHRFPVIAGEYQFSQLAYKITLVTPSIKDLETLYGAYQERCGVTLVKDAGLTVFEGPQITCLGLGPVDPDELDQDIKDLKVLI